MCVLEEVALWLTLRCAPVFGQGKSNRQRRLVSAVRQLKRGEPSGSPRSALRYLVDAEAPCSSWQDCTQRAICSITHHALQSETE